MPEHSAFDWVTNGEFEYRYVCENEIGDEYWFQLKDMPDLKKQSDPEKMVNAQKLYTLCIKFINKNPEFEFAYDCKTLIYPATFGYMRLIRKRKREEF